MVESQVARGPGAMVWTGRVIVVLVGLALFASGVMKFFTSPEMAKGMEHLGWPLNFAIALGITELTCVVIYLIPQTSVLGAILLTGYMGGAIATHARLGEAFFVQALIGVLVWLGLFLSEPRLRSLIPIRW